MKYYKNRKYFTDDVTNYLIEYFKKVNNFKNILILSNIYDSYSYFEKKKNLKGKPYRK